MWVRAVRKSRMARCGQLLVSRMTPLQPAAGESHGMLQPAAGLSHGTLQPAAGGSCYGIWELSIPHQSSSLAGEVAQA